MLDGTVGGSDLPLPMASRNMCQRTGRLCVLILDMQEILHH